MYPLRYGMQNKLDYFASNSQLTIANLSVYNKHNYQTVTK